MWFFTFGNFYQSDQFFVIMSDFEDKQLVVWPIFGKNDQNLIRITKNKKLYGYGLMPVRDFLSEPMDRNEIDQKCH